MGGGVSGASRSMGGCPPHMHMHAHTHTHMYTCIEIANGC